MLKIQQHMAFVKRQLDYQTRQRERAFKRQAAKLDAGGDATVETHKALLHDRIVSELEALLEAMTFDIDRANGADASGLDPAMWDLFENPTSLTPAHLRDLPQELVQQLQISESDKFQWDVVDLINRASGQTMSIEVLLIGLYRLTGKIYDRTDLSNKLYRLTKKGVLFTVQGRKGFYTTTPDGLSGADMQESDGEALAR